MNDLLGGNGERSRVGVEGGFGLGDEVELGDLREETRKKTRREVSGSSFVCSRKRTGKDRRNEEETRERRSRKETHLQILIQPNHRRRCESQTQAVSKREPVPELSEESHSNDSAHVLRSRLGNEGDSNVPSSSVDDSLSESGSELGHRVLVLVGDDGSEGLSNGSDLGVLSLGLLDEDHGEGDESSLTNEVDGIFGERFEEIDGFL